MKNLNDIKKRLIDWHDTINLFVKSIRMSDEMKTEKLIQAKKQSEDFLAKKGLTTPFDTNLEQFEMTEFLTLRRPFRVAATYDKKSCMMGTIKISIMFHLIGDVNKNIYYILHEYSHAIYEEGMRDKGNMDLWSEIMKLQKYCRNHFADRYDYSDKEAFCDVFPLFIMDEITFHFNAKDIDNINNICNDIVTQFSSLYQKNHEVLMKNRKPLMKISNMLKLNI